MQNERLGELVHPEHHTRVGVLVRALWKESVFFEHLNGLIATQRGLGII